MCLIVQQKLYLGRDTEDFAFDKYHRNGVEHCENWFDAILHRKIATVSSSSDDSPEGLHANEESERRVTEKV
jgi:hypothetical protein